MLWLGLRRRHGSGRGWCCRKDGYIVSRRRYVLRIANMVTMLIGFADGSKVVAQTPDGTRVATPNPNSAPGPSASGSNASPPKPSYAAALKNKPSDWQLEFSMDDHVLPLDMTIYGAVHQHESRKTSGAPVQTNIIWQGVYTVKYKKVTGPRQVPESKWSRCDFSSCV